MSDTDRPEPTPELDPHAIAARFQALRERSIPLHDKPSAFVVGASDPVTALADAIVRQLPWIEDAPCRGTLADYFREAGYTAPIEVLATCHLCPWREDCETLGGRQFGYYGGASRFDRNRPGGDEAARVLRERAVELLTEAGRIRNGTVLSMEPITFTMPAPCKPWSINEERSHHWSWRSGRIKNWRRASFYAARAASVPAMPPSEITVSLPFAAHGRRDPSNYLPPVKALIDGLVDAGLWPDDTEEYVSVAEPRLVVGATQVVVTIVPRP